jgi:hypothetical protein
MIHANLSKSRTMEFVDEAGEPLESRPPRIRGLLERMKRTRRKDGKVPCPSPE